MTKSTWQKELVRRHSRPPDSALPSASIVGPRDLMKTVGALVSQGMLAVDSSKRLGPNSAFAVDPTAGHLLGD